MVAPHLEEMSKTMEDVVFLKVDVDDCEDIAAEYKVFASCIALYCNGKFCPIGHRHANLPLHQVQG